MMLCREFTLSEAAFSGARTVPGEEGWAKGSTVVGRLPQAPMIWVSQEGVGVFTTSTPGNLASVSIFPSPRTERAESGFWRGQGGKTPGKCVEKYPQIAYIPFPSSEIDVSQKCTQVEKRLTAIVEKESEENNNEVVSQASSRDSILSRAVSRTRISSRKLEENRLQEFKKKEEKSKKSKKVKKKPRPIEAALHPRRYIV